MKWIIKIAVVFTLVNLLTINSFAQEELEAKAVQHIELEVPDELVEYFGAPPRREKFNPAVKLSQRPSGNFPDLYQHSFNLASEPNTIKVVYWKSDDFYHENLLFEELPLERYGPVKQRPGRQFLHSTKHFFVRSLLLPIAVFRGKHLNSQLAPGIH